MKGASDLNSLNSPQDKVEVMRFESGSESSYHENIVNDSLRNIKESENESDLSPPKQQQFKQQHVYDEEMQEEEQEDEEYQNYYQDEREQYGDYNQYQQDPQEEDYEDEGEQYDIRQLEKGPNLDTYENYND